MRLRSVIPLNSSTTQKEGKNSQCKGLFLSNSPPWDKRGILLQVSNNQPLAVR